MILHRQQTMAVPEYDREPAVALNTTKDAKLRTDRRDRRTESSRAVTCIG